MTALINRTAVPGTTSHTGPTVSPSTDRPVPHRTDIPDHAKILLRRLTDLPEGHSDRHWIRDRIIQMCLPLAEHLAARFRHRGEPDDDLRQVAVVGLMKAVDGFDPNRGVDFSGYAIPTIVGELKRHFRDKGWIIRVPRRLQELKLDIAKAVSDLTQSMQGSPTVADIAGYIGCPEEEVLEALDAANAYSAVSLAAPVSGEESSTFPTVADLLGFDDIALDRVEDRAALRPLLARLPERERRIIAMRFFDSMTQSEIAEKVGISQMHVSRLLSRSLAQLRRGMLAD